MIASSFVACSHNWKCFQCWYTLVAVQHRVKHSSSLISMGLRMLNLVLYCCPWLYFAVAGISISDLLSLVSLRFLLLQTKSQGQFANLIPPLGKCALWPRLAWPHPPVVWFWVFFADLACWSLSFYSSPFICSWRALESFLPYLFSSLPLLL